MVRENPWTGGSTNFRRRKRRTESVEGVLSISPPIEKTRFLLSRCHGRGEDADREELMCVTTIFLCCHTVVTRRYAHKVYILR